MKGQHNQKYSYSGDDYPTNNGSIKHPGRYTVRCGCRDRARLKKAVRRIAESHGETDLPQSAVFLRHILPMIETYSWRNRLVRAAKRRPCK